MSNLDLPPPRAITSDITQSEIYEVLKTSNLDSDILARLIEKISDQIHDENMKALELKKEKMHLDYNTLQKSQDYAMLIAALGIICGSVLAFLITIPWIGVAIAATGVGIPAVTKLLKQLKSFKQAEKALTEMNP